MSEDLFKKSAHDLNNILTGLINGIELLKQNLNDKEETKKLISNLEKNSQRASKIVKSYLNPNSDESNIELINVPELVIEMIASFSEEEKEKIKLSFPKELPKILADETEIFRMIQNLLKNALEATQKFGQVTVSGNTMHENGTDYLQLKVSDSGVGIAKENLSKIFDPKFSTKRKETQSGFGLSNVKEEVEKLGGKITANSKNNLTEFILYLPFLNKSKSIQQKVLLAEDDESVSEVLADLLESQGFKVSLAVNGKEAVDFVNNSFFDVLIVDKKMPEMDGIDCIKSIRKNNLEVPIILASGSDINEAENGYSELKISKVIKKPYKFPEILEAIHNLSV